MRELTNLEQGGISPDTLRANEADVVWLTRYEQRVRNEDIHAWRDAWSFDGLVVPSTPVYGIDGGLYTAYILDNPSDNIYRVIVDYPGWVDRLTFNRAEVPESSRGDGAIRRWLDDRADLTPRPILPAASLTLSRLHQEETVLAHLLANPSDLDIVRWLPDDAFSADLRHVYITTMRHLYESGQGVSVAAVAAGVDRQISALSDWHRQTIESRSAPHAYLERIAHTKINPNDVLTAAQYLVDADIRVSLASKSATYLAKNDYARLQPRPIQVATPVSPVDFVKVLPGRQQLWPPPQPADTSQLTIEPPF
ncbi:hypothetical protein [Catenulispora rubra]|uniref:hypothetical protein n=1 Tax=Catenulispora rubra TaxID=280293 RepID=UPI0018926B77|nr:hypothetical protein [Catenulispora rubra]